jgi:hypothetical protein
MDVWGGIQRPFRARSSLPGSEAYPVLCRPIDREPRVLVESIFPGRELRQVGMQDKGRGGFRGRRPWGFFPKPEMREDLSDHVLIFYAVIAVIANHLLALVGDVGAPVCVRHAQAGMAASHSRASKGLVRFRALDS